ncbi:hypothetical protein SeMB42_g03780 [Synchytrium endobioticum]|uniref:Uncharacterized protein n=1 Tax=Synchytrium endobioticum TaxID=286115 RepID=A0A507D463_9FUNG|nr:hypothetical protein SeMB42_g03780 [Synchytrium endobioticum]TPX48325.1 hypothetical protein SeLEV6574_g02080 [Synchytrium endobioticum]TPX48346.1 hypothetical protein SeLEV6574_g02093 [Synchytrium endobioticum]
MKLNNQHTVFVSVACIFSFHAITASGSGPRHVPAALASSPTNTTVAAAERHTTLSVAVAATPSANHNLQAVTTPVPDEIKAAAEREAHTAALARHLAAGEQKLYVQAYAEGYSQGYDRAHYSAHDRIVSFYGSGYLPDGSPCSGLCQWRVSDRDAVREHGESGGQRVGNVKQVAAQGKVRDDVVSDRVVGLAAADGDDSCKGRCSGL